MSGEFMTAEQIARAVAKKQPSKAPPLASNLAERLRNFAFGLRGLRMFEVDAVACEEAADELLRLNQLVANLTERELAVPPPHRTA